MALTRPLASIAAVALIVIGLVVLLPDCASACSCAYAGAPGELTYSSAVFSGEVVDFDMKGPFNATATLRVSEVWKGPEQETLEVSTPVSGSACGYPFKEGQEYLVYADGGKQGLEVNACGPTQRLTEASADLKVLGAGKKPTGGEVLSDTSGRVSAGAMVGLAGLVMATSLLVVVRLVRTCYT